MSDEGEYSDDIHDSYKSEDGNEDDCAVVLCDQCGDSLPPIPSYSTRSLDSIDHLRTGMPLDKAASAEINRSYKLNKKHLTRINDEIDRFNGLIRELVFERDNVEDELSRQKALLAPIRRLPTEILDDVMVLVWEEAKLPKSRSRDILQTRRWFCTSLIMSHVCRYWREAAIANQRLWSSIVIEKPGPYDVLGLRSLLSGNSECFVGNVECSPAAQWLVLSLDRSGSCPLTITYEYGSRDRDSTPPFEVIQQSNRWDSLTIPGHCFYHIPDDCDLSSLESLEIQAAYFGSKNHKWPRAFANAPRLTTVVSCRSLETVALPWAQLASLTLLSNEDPTKLLLSSISQCHLLHKLDLELHHDQPLDFSSQITLSSLSEFAIRYRSRRSVSVNCTWWFNICQAFSLPSLTSLVFSSNHGLVSSNENISSLLRRSKSRVTSFAIYGAKFDRPGSLVELLTLMPDLRSLRLEESGIPINNDRVVDELVIRNLTLGNSPNRKKRNQKALLPNLRNLSLKGDFRYDDTGKIVTSLLDSRTSKLAIGITHPESFSVHLSMIMGLSDDGYISDPDLDQDEVYHRRKKQLRTRAKAWEKTLGKVKMRNVRVKFSHDQF